MKKKKTMSGLPRVSARRRSGLASPRPVSPPIKKKKKKNVMTDGVSLLQLNEKSVNVFVVPENNRGVLTEQLASALSRSRGAIADFESLLFKLIDATTDLSKKRELAAAICEIKSAHGHLDSAEWHADVFDSEN